MRAPIWVSVLALTATSLGLGQSATPVVKAHSVMATDAAHAGSALKVAVLAQVAAGYHINDHKPSLDYLIPTEFRLDSDANFAPKSVVYPKGNLKRFSFSQVPLSVYEASVVVGVILQAGKAVPAGTYPLKAKLAFQACNEHACLAPTSVPLTITVKVVPPGVPLRPTDSDVFRRIKFEQ